MKDQDWTGALFVTPGEARFAVRVGLLTAAHTLIREKMTSHLWRFGPHTPDGTYKQVEVSSDDRSITPAHLRALHEVIGHPSWFDHDEVVNARYRLPGLEAQYATTQDQKRTIRVRYARTGDGSSVVAAVTALDADLTIVVESSAPWDETPAFALGTAGAVTGTGAGLADPGSTGHFALCPDRAPDSSALYASIADMTAAQTGGTGAAGNAVAALRYDLAKGETLTFTAACGSSVPDLSAPQQAPVLATLDAAQGSINNNYLTGSGPAGRVAAAVRDALSLNTNYDRTTYRNFVMWGWGGGGGLFTGWDSSFDAIEAASVDATLAGQHERDVYAAPAPPNQVMINGPRYDQENAGPMHAYAVWRLYTKLGDRQLVEDVYPQIVTFFDLLPEWDADGDGLLEAPYFGDRIGGRGNHLGLDDSPVYAAYQSIPKTGGSGDPRPNTNLTDVALNSYYALMADVLTKMATLLGRPDDAARFRTVFTTVRSGLNARLWNAERGLYLSRYLDGTWDQVVTPTVFYPLFAGIATPKRAKILVEQHLLNPEEFWGDYVIPSVARNDPTYCSGGPIHPQSQHFTFFNTYGDGSASEQWKGACWPPMNYTVYDGLKRYGFDLEAGQFAARSTAMYLDSYDADGWFPESFDPIPGQSIMGPAVDTAWRTYTWCNAMAIQTVHELISDDPWGDPDALLFGSLGLPGTNTVSNVVLRGHVYSVECGPRVTTVVRDGQVLFAASGGRVAVRNFRPTGNSVTFDVTAESATDLTVRTGRGLRTARVGQGRTHVKL